MTSHYESNLSVSPHHLSRHYQMNPRDSAEVAIMSPHTSEMLRLSAYILENRLAVISKPSGQWNWCVQKSEWSESQGSATTRKWTKPFGKQLQEIGYSHIESSVGKRGCFLPVKRKTAVLKLPKRYPAIFSLAIRKRTIYYLLLLSVGCVGLIQRPQLIKMSVLHLW